MKIKKLDVPFTQVINSVIYDPNLSLKAKGVFAYIQAKPENYDFASDRIALENRDGIDSVKSALAELQNAGYLKRTRNYDGTMDYELFVGKIPQREIPSVGKSLRGKSPRIINKDIIKIKNNIQGFKKPTIQEIKQYCKDRNSPVDPEEFWHKNESIGWVVGVTKKPMKSWQSAIWTWEKNIKLKEKPSRAIQAAPKVEELTDEDIEKNRKKMAEIKANLFKK